MRSGTVLNNYAHIFELLMRMRQSVNHPWLVTHRSDSSKDRDVCGICHEPAEDAIATTCKHVFCREEISLYVTSNMSTEPVCPVCFRPLSIDLTQPTMEMCVAEGKFRLTREGSKKGCWEKEHARRLLMTVRRCECALVVRFHRGPLRLLW